MPISSGCSKNSKRWFLVLVAAFLCLMTGGAFAQGISSEEPVQTELKASGAIVVQEEFPAPVDPCPLPAAEMAKSPDDLAKIQGDIDRYTLCMERAQLLQRLNDLAIENQEKLNEAGGLSADNPGMQLGNLPDFANQKNKVMAGIDKATMDEIPSSAPPEAKEWYIVKISGSGANLYAQLGKTDGTLNRVQSGDTLPDGASVTSVNATSVGISKDGENKDLRWIDSAPGGGW